MKTNMKTKKMILPMVCCIPLLSSCATSQTTDKQSWNIQPVYKVNNKAADSPDTMYQLGRYYQGQRRYEQAAEAYHKALAADGSFVEAHNGLGVIYSMQGRYDEAVTEFKTAISQAPKAAHLYNNLGHALYLQGAYAEAVSVLKQAAALDPENPRTLNNLALAYAKAGEADKSRQVFAEAAKPTSADSAVVAHATSDKISVSQPAPVEPISSAKQVHADATVVAHASSDQADVSQLTPIKPVSGAKPASTDTAVAAYAASDKISVSQPAPIEPNSGAKQAVATQPTVQTLALPKDRGVIRSAAAIPVATTESRVETGPIAPNVYEPSERAEPVRRAAIVATTAVAPEAATTAPAPVTQADSSAVRLHLEVSNGNGVTGMARKVAYFLHDSGYAKARLTNRKPFTVQTTQIQYRYGHQADAEHLQSSLPGYTRMVQSNNLRTDINLRVVLGKDMMQRTAYFNDTSQTLRLVRNDSDF